MSFYEGEVRIYLQYDLNDQQSTRKKNWDEEHKQENENT